MRKVGGEKVRKRRTPGVCATDWRRAVGAAVRMALAAAVLAGCSTRSADDGAGSEQARPHTYEATDVLGVRAGADPHTILLDLRLAAGQPGCAGDVDAAVRYEDAERVMVEVTFSSSRVSTYGACPTYQTRTATLSMRSPLGARDLVVNGGRSGVWTATAAGYRRCDDLLGCRPPADRCDDRWLSVPLNDLDVPRQHQTRVVRCAVPWAVIEVSYRMGGCPPADGGAGTCAGAARVTRYFLRFDRNRWRILTGSHDPGCVTVRSRGLEFPEAVCRDLGPVG